MPCRATVARPPLPSTTPSSRSFRSSLSYDLRRPLVLFPNGTVSLPGISFLSDQNCGLNCIAGDDIAIAVGGSKLAELSSLAGVTLKKTPIATLTLYGCRAGYETILLTSKEGTWHVEIFYRQGDRSVDSFTATGISVTCAQLAALIAQAADHWRTQNLTPQQEPAERHPLDEGAAVARFYTAIKTLSFSDLYSEEENLWPMN